MTGLVGWWPLHDDSGNTARDLSGNGNHGAVNSVKKGLAGKGGLTAYSFDGSSSRVDAGNDSTLDVEDEFTVSAWVKIDNQSTNKIVNKRDKSTVNFELNANTNGGFRLAWNTNGNWYALSSEDSVLPTGEWHHVSGTSNPQTNSISIYLDGELRKSTNPSEMPSSTSSVPVAIGDEAGRPGTGVIDGNISDARLYNRALSPQEIQTLYKWGSGDFASPPNDRNDSSSAVSRWDFDDSGSSGTLNDRWSGNNGSITGASYVSDSVRGEAMKFDGSGDYVDLGSPGSLDMNGNSFTVSGWLKVKGSGSRNSIIVRSMDAASDGDGLSYALYENNSSAKFRIHDSSSNGNIVSAGIQNTGWNHVAGVRDAGNNLQVFVNGTLKSTGSDINPRSTTETVRIGNNPDGDKWQMDGLVDDLRVYSRALSHAEIFELYQWGTRGRDMRKLTVNSR